MYSLKSILQLFLNLGTDIVSIRVYQHQIIVHQSYVTEGVPVLNTSLTSRQLNNPVHKRKDCSCKEERREDCPRNRESIKDCPHNRIKGKRTVFTIERGEIFFSQQNEERGLSPTKREDYLQKRGLFIREEYFQKRGRAKSNNLNKRRLPI